MSVTRPADRPEVAVVTGAGRGIGLATARRFAVDGYLPLLVDQRADVHQAAESIPGARATTTDVRDPEALRAVMALAAELGALHVLVNCAGTCQRSGFADMTAEQWEVDIDTNLSATFFACQAAVFPHMRAQRYGRIVNVASVSGKLGGIGPVSPDGAEGRSGAAYAASKAGTINLTRWIARETGRWGITCNSVAPGPIDTPMTAGQVYALADAPIARFGRPDEVAAAVAYLAAPERGFSTGTCLHVDGGLVCA